MSEHRAVRPGRALRGALLLLLALALLPACRRVRVPQPVEPEDVEEVREPGARDIVWLSGRSEKKPANQWDRPRANGTKGGFDSKSTSAGKTEDKKTGGDEKARERPKSPPPPPRPGSPPPADKKGTPPPKGPVVWKRDASRPTFARVYIGDGNSLELVSLHVNVVVEGPRARTVVDHVFRNPHGRQLEGTFEYPLPSGASPSYFAMFLGQTRDTIPVRFGGKGLPPLPADALAQLTPQQLVKQIDTADWGKLQVARVVAQERAREAYEDIVRGNIDPALLEYAGGNTFRGRVFPIPSKGYNRVVLAYEETLPIVEERQAYRFALPDRHLQELRFTLTARTADSSAVTVLPKELKKEEKAGRLSFAHTWKDTKPGGEVLFSSTPTSPRVQALSGRHGDGARYFYARVRPQLPAVEARPFAEHGVFLLDTSLSEHPERFAVSMRLLKSILEGDPDLKHFNVLAFDAGAGWVEPTGWLPNTREGREKALARLDGLVLEGATDLSAALEKLVAPGFTVPAGTPVNAFLLSDGNLTWGETDLARLVADFERRCPLRVRWHCYRTGLGEENAELFDLLTRTGGATFACFSEAEVARAALAHRRQCLTLGQVRFAGGPAASEVLVAGRRAAVYPGGELLVAAKFTATGKTMLVLEGTFQGKAVKQELPVEVVDGSELAPRAWGEVAVAALQALHDPLFDRLITAYCQEFNLAGRVASFLVLEDEADYKRLDLETERGKTLGADLGRFVEQAWQARARPVTGRLAFERLFAQIDARSKLVSGPKGKALRELLPHLQDDDYELPSAQTRGTLLRTKDVPKAYLEGRQRDRRDAALYIDEAQRRAGKGDRDGAVRALSSIIEEHQGRGEAFRLVGYRLLALHEPAQAARLFGQVLRQWPFEPHSYRDLARSLEQAGKYGLAAAHYEAVLAGTWHRRFGGELAEVVREEYARMMQVAVREKKVRPALGEHFAGRLAGFGPKEAKADLRVTITWNTDATDIDLWVIEPDGTRVFYGHRNSPSGGQLSQDLTQGYGPERYHIATAKSGEYRVMVHYFAANRNLLGGETHVEVVVRRKAGSPEEQVERRTFVLRKTGDLVTACKVKF